MDKIAKFSIQNNQIKAILVGATISDWSYIKNKGFTCWDDYIYTHNDSICLLLLAVTLNELNFNFELNRS
jgi:hypothetical protein